MNRSLFQRDFVLVLIGQIISLFGNSALRLALPLYLLDQTGSAALFGLVSAAAFLPMIVLSPVGGVAADRLPKARIMACLDCFTAALTVGAALFLGWAPLVPLILAVLMLLFGIQGFYNPAVQASIPLLVGPEDLVSANAAINMVSSLSGLFGPILGGALYGSFGLRPILWISAGCFLISAVMELFIHIPHVAQPNSGTPLRTAAADLRDSARFLFRQKPSLAVCALLAFSLNLVLCSMINIGYPVLITGQLGMESHWYSLVEAAAGAGGLLGGSLAGFWGRRLQFRSLPWLILGCAGSALVMALPFLLAASVPVTYGLLLLAVLLLMILCAMCSILLIAHIQEETPDHLTGKIMSCVMALSICAQPVGQALYGLLFEALADRPWQILLGAAAVTALIALAARKIFRQAARLTKDTNLG